MAFYDEISNYYDKIFKVSKDTIDFLKTTIKAPPKNVLDIACGTGGYALSMSSEGYNLTAIDIDEKMIENLKSKTTTTKNEIKFFKADMLDIKRKFKEEEFQGIYCIGNSLVHLENLELMKKFFQDVYALLSNDGVFVFQIINYDRIISKGIKSLPTITDETVPLKFERKYSYDKQKNKVLFKTVLHLENEVIKNEIYLTPLMYDDAFSLMNECGFKEINACGDFKKSNFNKEESYSLVISAKKQ